MPEIVNRIAKTMEGPLMTVGKRLSESARVCVNRWKAGKEFDAHSLLRCSRLMVVIKKVSGDDVRGRSSNSKTLSSRDHNANSLGSKQ